MKQKGFAPVIFLIAGAVIIGIAAVAYGIWTVKSPPQETPALPSSQTQASSEAIIHPADPECPDTDYTGCDSSSQFMTWDGKNESQGDSYSGQTIFSK